MTVYNKARELVAAIRQEQVYQEFINWQKQVFADDKLKEMLLDLRKRELELQRLQLLGKEVKDEQKQAVEQLYKIARHHSVLGKYLEAEYRFSIMMMDIQKIIGEVIPGKLGPENQG